MKLRVHIILVVASALLVRPVATRPVRAATLPTNVLESRLSTKDGTIRITPVQIPYFVGERLILNVTVTNATTRTRNLPPPSRLLIYRPNESSGDPFWRFQHDCKINACADLFFEACVPYAPGESRSATWQGSGWQVRRWGADRTREDPSMTRGIVISGHWDPSDATYLYYQLRPFTDPVQGELLASPKDGVRSFYLTAPTESGDHVVLSVGGWASFDRLPSAFDAKTLNRLASGGAVIRYGTAPHAKARVALDEGGDVVIDRVKRKPRLYFPDGWVLPDQVNPASPASPAPSPSN